MKAKKFLNQFKELQENIKDKYEKLEYLKDRIMNMSIAFKGEEVVSGSRNPHKNEDLIIEKIMLEKEIENDLLHKTKLMNEILEVINKLDHNKMEHLLQCRYLFFMKWEDISDLLHISIRHTHRLHKKALQKIEKILN